VTGPSCSSRPSRWTSAIADSTHEVGRSGDTSTDLQCLDLRGPAIHRQTPEWAMKSMRLDQHRATRLLNISSYCIVTDSHEYSDSARNRAAERSPW